MPFYSAFTRESTATAGTGTMTLAGAVSGFLSFDDVSANGQTVDYAIHDLNGGKEEGRGVYTAAGRTLTRDTVFYSTNGGSKITLSGNAEVFINISSNLLTLINTALTAGAVGVDGAFEDITATGTISQGINSTLFPGFFSDGVIPNPALFSTDKIVFSYTNTAPAFTGVVAGSGALNRAVFKGVRARGTLDVPLVPNTNDSVLSLVGTIYDGATGQGSATIEFFVDGAVSAGVAPQRVSIQTSATTGAARTTKLTVDSVGAVTIPLGTLTVKSDIIINTGLITSASGTISLDNENLSTTGTLTVGTATATSLQAIIGNITPAAGTFTTLTATGVTKFPDATYPLMSWGGYHFDGSTNYLDTNPLTGIADGKKFTIVVMVRFANAASASEIILNSTGSSILLLRTSTGKIQLTGENAAGTTILNIITTTTVCASAGTYLIMMSGDLASAGSGRIYIDQVSNYTENTFTNDTIDYTVTEWSIGASFAGTSFFSGDIYVVWFSATTNLEFNTSSVRRLFADPNLTPIFLGRNGELPTGTAPILFHAYDDYTSWPRQRGSATSAWTENGTPAVVTTALNGQSAPLSVIGIPKTVTADYTVDRTDTTIINNRAATNTLTFPTAANSVGRRLRIQTIQAQTVVSAASDIIPITGGAAGTAILAAADGAFADLEATAAGWQITSA